MSEIAEPEIKLAELIEPAPLNRVSVVPGDPGYDPEIPRSRNYIVLFNGVERHGCYTADSTKGEILAMKRDDAGNIDWDGDEPAREWLSGSVVIIPMQ